MCGIAGVAWTNDGAPPAWETLVRMTGVLAHRGPDAAGYYHSAIDPALALEAGGSAAGFLPGPGAALGHRRLSIIDLAGGQQPLCNEDGTVWIVFNGEIYNYRELRPGLEARGHAFHTASDTETIVHLYEEYGTACVEHLRGMFAFAIWDQRRRRLFLARDRMGQKPLFYRLEDNRLLFGSELKALLQVPDVPRRVDPAALDDYLTYQYVPHPECILEGFRKLPPAHWAEYHDDRLHVERYWKPGYDAPVAATPPDYPAAQALLRETLTEAVRLRLRSDVPLGAFLSGGIDSTIITGLMQQLSERPVQTFSIGFPVAAFDERSYAREAARHLRTEHHELVVEPAALEILPKLAWHYDEPFADSSAIPTMYLSRMTREHVTVALSGDGGDELFAGYDRYKAVRLLDWVDRCPGIVRKMLGAELVQRWPCSPDQRSLPRKLKRLLSNVAQPPERRYMTWLSIFDAPRRQRLYSGEFAQRLGQRDAAAFALAAYAACTGRDFVTRTTCVDVLTYLPCDILTKVDIASMAYGLEAHSPFMDHHVAELAARLPIEYKLRGWRSKRILLDTFRDLLPRSIQTRRKMGFGVPLGHWFRNELRPLLEGVLLDERCLARGYFDPSALRGLIQEHVSGRWDHNSRLWSLLCLELWHRNYVDSCTVPQAPQPLVLAL